MRSIVCEAKLSMEDFTRFFEKNRLGKLYFPNGGVDVHLHDLYRLVTGWRINGSTILLENIVAIIAFGSAVRVPTQIRMHRKKFFFFGPKVTRFRTENIIPKDVDFLVITSENISYENKAEPVFKRDSYDGYLHCVEVGIHVLSRGIEQIMSDVKSSGTVGISALTEGVPIFLDERFEKLLEDIATKPTAQRKIFWEENREGILQGIIK